MSWKSNNAFKRLGNTFKRLHEKKLIYKEDVEALKTLQDVINELTELRVKEHTLFAKLLCTNIYWNLIRFGNITEAIKWVQMDLDVNLTSHIEQLTNELNIQQITNLMKSKDITFELVEDKESRERNLELIKKHEKEFTNKILEKWTYDVVKKSFEKTANEMISNPDNYTI